MALLVSICALLLTVYQAMATRKHNRLTVKPHLTSFVSKTSDPNRNILSVIATLSNNGLGPAIIDTYELLYDGVPIKAADTNELAKAVAEIIPAPILSDGIYFSVLRRNYVVAKDEKIIIAQLSIVQTLKVTDEQLKKVLENFHIKVTYKSAYEEFFPYSYDSRKHIANKE